MNVIVLQIQNLNVLAFYQDIWFYVSSCSHIRVNKWYDL